MNLLEFARQEPLRPRQAAGPTDVRTETAPGLEHRRREIFGSLTEWCRHCGYEPAAHHRLIVEELEALERGEFTNLAISAPPGSAKTTLPFCLHHRLSDSIRGLSVVEADCDEQKLMNCILCYLFARRLRFGNRLERTPFKRLLGVKRTP